MITRFKLLKKMTQQRFDPLQMLLRFTLRHHLTDCKSVLDAGCGEQSPLQIYEISRSVGLEGFAPSVERARANGTHHEVVFGDVRQLSQHFAPRQFDACIALDVIEHLQKEEGWAFLDDLERIAKKRVVILTPSGFLPQGHAESGDLQAHHSGWDPQEMRARGYTVLGLLGPKAWRGEYHALRYRPRVLWAMLSLLAHLLWTGRHPESAAAMLCIKDVSSNS